MADWYWWENGPFFSLVDFPKLPDCDIWWCPSLLYWYMVIYSNTSGLLYIWLPLLFWFMVIYWFTRGWLEVSALFVRRAPCLNCAMMPWPSGAIGSMIGICRILWDTLRIDHQPNGLWFLKMGHTPWNGMEYTIYYDMYDICDLLWWDRTSTKLIWKWGIPLERDTDDEAQIWR